MFAVVSLISSIEIACEAEARKLTLVADIIAKATLASYEAQTAYNSNPSSRSLIYQE